MKSPRRTLLLSLAGLCAALLLVSASAKEAFTPAELKERTVHRRAVEAVIWGMPLVSVDAMREAYFRDAGAKYNDILYWSKPSDWRLQFTTPNASTHYVYFNFNLKEGPVVLDVPPTVGAGLFGSLVDAWQVPLADVGPEGDDAGKGGKYLLLPPSYKDAVPDGYFPVRLQTYNGYGLLRAIPASKAEADEAKAIALVKQLRLYTFSQAANPAAQRYIDMAGKLLDGVVAFDASYYARLARMVNEEPVLTRDLIPLAQFRSVGLEKGKAFKPDAPTKKILSLAAAEAHAGLMFGIQGGESWWPGSKWRFPETVGPKTEFTFQTKDALFVDNRALVYYLAFAAPKKLGAATFYLVGGTDAKGEALHGGETYRLHVPAGVPARQYWAITVYDLETCCLIRDLPKPGLDSFDQNMQRNADGSVDIYFGPKAPAGQEANWIPTAPGKLWFGMFRFYGPEKPLFEKTWVLPDIEKVK